ncbi:MAG: hypothetical protein LUO88_03180, partial [Methanoregulaceae archaeon]|nr:hypothetical protein [Methanoregulaceae archaeon]
RVQPAAAKEEGDTLRVCTGKPEADPETAAFCDLVSDIRSDITIETTKQNRLCFHSCPDRTGSTGPGREQGGT